MNIYIELTAQYNNIAFTHREIEKPTKIRWIVFYESTLFGGHTHTHVLFFQKMIDGRLNVTLLLPKSTIQRRLLLTFDEALI